MKKVWKYPLQFDLDNEFWMSGDGGRVVHVGEQCGSVMLWAEVSIGDRPKQRVFRIFGTGNAIPAKYATHVGTVQIDGFVWHVYEKHPEENAA